MSSELQKQGFMAQSLTSDDTEQHRKQRAADLREGKIHYLCVVDIFNEGVDIPEIDTVLFLRPTESLTIFLQQLGRGLRLAPGKTELTVLDFVAQANKKYDFTNKFRALTLKPTKNIQREVQEGFTSLPAGCTIIMEKKARQYILDNIQSAIYNQARILREINSYSELPTLAQFLEANGQDIRLLYKGNRCWTIYKRLAGRINYTDDAITQHLTKGMNNLLHFNTLSFLHFVEKFVQGSSAYKAVENKTYALMLYYTLFQDRLEHTGFASIYDALALVHLAKYHFFKEEMGEIVAYLIEHLSIKTQPLENGLFPGLDLHGCYTREDVFVLTGKQTETLRMQGAAAGVFDLSDQNTTLLFVTLNKSDKDFSPSTQYDDYVINENYFHWQSQNKDSHNNRGGKRYTEQKLTNKKILLFVREDKKDGFGNTSPFHCFGLVDYVSSHGDLPMNVTWKLREPVLPQYLKAL